MQSGNMIIKNASQIVTCSGTKAKKGKEMQDLHVVENGAILIEKGIIQSVGKEEEILKGIDESQYQVIDAEGKAVLPGFVDSHTHFVFGGYRAEEFTWRLRGDDYMDIMNRGGGIISTVQATQEESKEELYENGYQRLTSMLSFGVTTAEGKSGYGLNKETELKQLEVMKEINENHPVDVISTFMEAHAVPAEYKGKEDEMIENIIRESLPEIKEKNLAEFCDIFTEKNVFTIEQSRRLLTAAAEMGFKLKMHADEIVPLGGAELAAEVGAVSADHLLQASDAGIAAMAEKDVVATLLPGTAFSLRESYARARDMIEANCAVALASDFNPGSCHTESIPLIIALATLYMGMSPEETITALTINGAAAVDRADSVGSLDPGKKADIIILRDPSYHFLSYHIGVNSVERVVKDGIMVMDNRHKLL
ncbi:imidazolonepropionase [Tindallia californiensis]|uniref:Imidazolonepropionase n=1 Tax=Tindallia californiensis TaxID=159292 RepID=A0A1H3MHI7_9FIRM|nr:imidazolonepropionase [Tindallia californiensis]SDY76106.1 imidazolonepropionase [Tindallia californiensis]